MTKYFKKYSMLWDEAAVLGGTVMEKCVIWEGNYDVRSGLYRMSKGMDIPFHVHSE